MKSLFPIVLIFISCNVNQSLNVQPDKVYDLLSNSNNNNSFLLDVRTKEEVIEKKITNSINIDFYSDSFKDSILKIFILTFQKP